LKLMAPRMPSGSAREMIVPAGLWLMVWAGYNTGIGRLVAPDFPTGAMDLLHGVRAFFPFIAAYIAIIMLLLRRPFPGWIFKGPLGMLLIYALVGTISSIFLSQEPVTALYWAGEYGAVLVVLMAILADSNSLQRVLRLIVFNWSLVGVIMVGLLLALWFMRDVAFAEMDYAPFKIFVFGGNIAGTSMWGMPATRNTGFGRYAGIAAIVALSQVWEGKRWTRVAWSLIFLFSVGSLVISQARTAILGFLPACFVFLWLKRRSIPLLGTGIVFTILILGITDSYEAFWDYLTRGSPFDLTLTGRTLTWREGWNVVFQESPWLGLGFHADRIYLQGMHMHNAFLQALIQSGLLGTVFFLAAFLKIWIFLIRTYLFPQKRGGLPFRAEIPAILLFVTVASISESTIAFYGAVLLFAAPLFAYIQLTSLTAEGHGRYQHSPEGGYGDGNGLDPPHLLSKSRGRKRKWF
jgi:O-antigen ligase